MIHLSIYNTSYGQTKGQESKCQFDSRPLKVKNRLKLHVWKKCVIYQWKIIDEIYNFVLDLNLIESLHKKLWASKMARVPISRIAGLLTWNLGVSKKMSFRCSPHGES
jgi:hypothetical protein